MVQLRFLNFIVSQHVVLILDKNLTRLDPDREILIGPFLQTLVEILAPEESPSDIEILENFEIAPRGVKTINSSTVIGLIEELPEYNVIQTYVLDFVQYEGKTSKFNFVKFRNSSICDIEVGFNCWQYKKNISQKYFDYRINGHCFFFGKWCGYNIFIVFHPICPDNCECEIGRLPRSCEDDYCRTGCDCNLKNSTHCWVPDDVSEIIQKEIAEKISQFPNVKMYHFTKENYEKSQSFDIPIFLFNDFHLDFEQYSHSFFERHHYKFVINKIGQNVPERDNFYESELCRFDLTRVKSFKFALAGDTKVEISQAQHYGVAAVFREERLPFLFGYPASFEHDFPGINYFPKAFQQNFGSVQSDSMFPRRMLELQRVVSEQSRFFNLDILSNQLYNQTSRLLRRNESVEIWRNLPISRIFSERLFSKRNTIFEAISKSNADLKGHLREIYQAGVGPRYEAVFNLTLQEFDDEDEVMAREQDFSLVLSQITNAFKLLCTTDIRGGIAWVREKVFPTILMAYNDILWRSIKQPIQKFCRDPNFKLTLKQMEFLLMVERLLLVNINGNYTRFLTGPCVYYGIKSHVENYSWPYFPTEYFDFENYSINLGIANYRDLTV